MSAVVRGRKLRLDGDNNGNSGRYRRCWTGRARSGEQDAREITERWIDALNAAIAGGQAAALSALFEADSHWRNLFGISWYFATFSGNAVVVSELLARAAEVRASGFRIDQAALAPRHSVVAGRDVIEAVFRFESANGPGYGAVRLVRQPDGTVESLDVLDLARFRFHRRSPRARRERIPHPRFRRARLARAAAGLRRPTRPAIPTC